MYFAFTKKNDANGQSIPGFEDFSLSATTLFWKDFLSILVASLTTIWGLSTVP